MKFTNNYLSGVIFCLAATLSWGVMFPIMTYALKLIDPFSFTAIRYTIACFAFFTFLYFKEGWAALWIVNDKVKLWLFGSAGFAGFGFFVFLGQKLAGAEGALSASMMMATMPLLGLLVNWFLKGVRPLKYSFVFIFMSFVGVLLVITKGDLKLILVSPSNYFANLLMVAGALCWVIYTVGASYFPKMSPVKYTAMTTLFGLPTIYAITFAGILTHQIELPSFHTITQISFSLVYMSLIAGFIGVLCWNQGNKIITPINGVLFMDIVPVTAFIVSTMQGIVPAGGQILGICLTASALIFNNIYQRRRLAVNSRAFLKEATATELSLAK